MKFKLLEVTRWLDNLVDLFRVNRPFLRCDQWRVKYHYFVHQSGWLFFKFQTVEDTLQVLQGRPYFVFKRPLMLKIVPHLFEFDDNDISSLSVWIMLLGLPLEL